ncbi:MAG: hypothetical protein WC648_01605 [Candidatus Paceibacterota bacterium]
MKYGKMDWGCMEAVINMIGGLEGVEKLLSGKAFVTDSFPAPAWSLWDRIGRHVKIGRFQTIGELLAALNFAKCGLTSDALDMVTLKRFPMCKQPTCVELVSASPLEVGLDFRNERIPVQQFYAAASKKGLDLCTAEIGLELRLQYMDQPRNECVRIAMEPLFDKIRRPSVFELIRFEHEDDQPFVRPSEQSARFDDRWIFQRRK